MVVRGTRKTYALLSLMMLVGLAYLELYPFTFRVPIDDGGPFQKLLESWAERPSRGDFLANIVAYIPLGFCATMALPYPRSRFGRIIVVVLAGSALSVSFEMAQYYIEGRVTAATDVYANTAGVTIGSIASVLWKESSSAVIHLSFSQPIPLFLLLDWFAYRLYPYVPTTDLHKFWTAVKPLLIAPTPNWSDLLRHSAIWLTLFALVSSFVSSRSFLPSLALVAFLLAARVSIVDKVLSSAEVAGAFIALCLWLILSLLRVRLRALLIAITLGTYILVERLQPFAFQDTDRQFGWVPFRSFMTGSPEINVMAMFEKSFLYGALLYLLNEAGLSLRTSAFFLGCGLFVTSWMEICLPERSAEITDAVLALMIAIAFSLVQLASEERSRRTAKR